MRRILALVIVALLCATVANAANEAAVVSKAGKFLVLTCTSPDTLAANTADNFTFLLQDVPVIHRYDDDGAATKWVLPVLISNTSSAVADSVNIYVQTSIDNTNWLSVIAVGNDNFALNGAEEKQSNISDTKVLGPYVRIGVKAVGSATTARAVKIAIPIE